MKVLGITWHPHEDRLQFCVTDIAEAADSTHQEKRSHYSTIGKFYDPLGFLAPVIIRFKGLFQKVCENKLQWDETLTGIIRNKWESLVEDLCNSSPVSIPRSEIEESILCSYTLCGFCDASTTAYAAVVYLVMKTPPDVHTQFVVAKTRVAPLQTVTIPRLELLSALLLT